MITKDDLATIREKIESGKVYDACLKFEKIFAHNNWTWIFPSGRESCPNHDEIYLHILSLVRDLPWNCENPSLSAGRISVKVSKPFGEPIVDISLEADFCAI